MGADPIPAGGAGSHPVGTCYLLHFDQRYEHAGHYTGWATDLDRRLPEHLGGRGARLLAVITQAGIGFRLARTWPGVTRARERQLKRQGGASRYCPICQDQRKARGIPRRPTPSRTGPAARAGDRTTGRQPAGPPERPGAGAVPTRGTTPGRVAAFLALNPGFARPVRASVAGQWGRARGREVVELLGPRVTVAWSEENRQLSQRRAATVTRRAARARTQARQEQAAERAEQTRLHTIAARTHQRLAARQHTGERAAGGQRRARGRGEAGGER
jgi:predicted GIY-YIG superfamily endonuclease